MLREKLFEKWINIFSKNFADVWLHLLFLAVPHLNFSIMYISSIEIQMIWCLSFCFLSDHESFGHFKLLFAEDGYEMYKVVKPMCWAIVLPMRSFVFPLPHYHLCLLMVSTSRVRQQKKKQPIIKNKLTKKDGKAWRWLKWISNKEFKNINLNCSKSTNHLTVSSSLKTVPNCGTARFWGIKSYDTMYM